METVSTPIVLLLVSDRVTKKTGKWSDLYPSSWTIVGISYAFLRRTRKLTSTGFRRPGSPGTRGWRDDDDSTVLWADHVVGCDRRNPFSGRYTVLGVPRGHHSIYRQCYQRREGRVKHGGKAEVRSPHDVYRTHKNKDKTLVCH